MTNTIATETMIAYNGHDAECICPPCMDADMNAFILATGGQDALDRINNEMQLIGGGKVDAERMRFMAPGTRSGRGFVRKISPKQARYINFLISTKDTSNIQIYPGQTLDPSKVNTMGLPAARALIDKLLNAPNKANDSDRKELSGSPRQIEWITKGLNGKPSLLQDKAILSESDISALYKEHCYSAKSIIDALLKMPRKATAPTKTEVALTEGLYKTKDGSLIKAKYTRTSGQLVGYTWESFTTPEETARGLKYGEFVYGGKRALNSLTIDDKMSIEEAMAHGIEFHYCCMCGIELTNPKSQAKGIGPVCESKF